MIASSPFKGRGRKNFPFRALGLAGPCGMSADDECGRAPEASADFMSDDPNDLDPNTPPRPPRDAQAALVDPAPPPEPEPLYAPKPFRKRQNWRIGAAPPGV